MKYFIIAGETSGDIHGANLIRQIKNMDEHAHFCYVGGEEMQKVIGEQGIQIEDSKKIALMGFWEVFTHLLILLKLWFKCQKMLKEYFPDVVVLIDYPGFNLRFAKFAKMLNFSVIYYISPKIWAWKTSRIHQIKKYVDKMLCILPFEPEFYQKYNYKDRIFYVGNPTVNTVENFKTEKNKNVNTKDEFLIKYHLKKDKEIIAVLPGSRTQEIKKMLPLLCKISLEFPEYQWVIAGAQGQNKAKYEKILTPYPHLFWIENQSYELLNYANFALVKSGTSTLETLVFQVPQIVFYKTSLFSYLIAKFFVKIPYISLVNLIAGKKIVEELIQYEFNFKNLTEQIKNLKSSREKMQKEYQICLEKLGQQDASYQAAKIIFTEAILKEKSNLY